MAQTYRGTPGRRWLAIVIVIAVAVIAAVLMFAMSGGGEGSGDGGGLYGAALALPAALRARNRTGS